MKFDPKTHIAGAELLIAKFGYWPSFHDAEVVAIQMRRGPESVTLECVVHAFSNGNSLDQTGQFLKANHCLVSLLFSGVEGLRLEDFNFQNAIDGVAIEGPVLGRLTVRMIGNNGCDLFLSCESIAVTSVREYSLEERCRDGSIYDTA